MKLVLLQVRYVLDDEFHLTTFLEDESNSNGFSLKELPWLPDIVKDFVLPAGFPGNKSSSYHVLPISSYFVI